RLDEPPTPGHTEEDLLGLVSGALHRAHDRIGELVEHDPSLNGTSTTATVALFDGERLAMGHVGDSRAYLFRDGGVAQITHDHTFVQTLIDEGRITEEESRVHPHRNLILRALDGMRDVEPDLFVIPLQAGDRIMLCSDGVSGVLPDSRLADVLATGSPDFAAVELVRIALEAGSTDNVTCLVADVVPADAPVEEEREPMLVGAAAELRRKLPLGAVSGLFRGHRMGDTGELEAVSDDGDEVPAGAIDHDPEEARYALHPPRRFPWLRRLLLVLAVVGVLWVAAAAGWSWTQTQWFVGEKDGKVAIYRGVHTTLLGLDLYKPYQTSDLDLDELADVYQQEVQDGLHQDSLAAARDKVRDLQADAVGADTGAATGTTEPSTGASTGTGAPSETP
ncbi:PP2C family serine/threonine-protein phosphatase, partial [Nocardioides sp. DS6]